MHTQRKRAVGVSAALVLSLALAACSSGGGASTGTSSGTAIDESAHMVGAMANFTAGEQFKATKPLDFSMLYSDHPNYPEKPDWLLWSATKEKTNVTLDPTLVPMSDYSQKRSLLIGSGDAPLIISKTYPGQETPFVASGAILPVSDYINLMPNFQKKVADWKLQGNLDGLRQADGKFYLLPGLHQDAWQDYTIAFRTDVLQKLGLKAPATWDDLYTVLKAIKKAYPSSYPLSDRFDGNSLLNVLAMTYGTSGGWTYGNAQWDASTKKFVFTGTSPEYKAMIEYLQKLVSEGLMDPESFTQSDDTAIQKFVTGKSFAISTNSQTIINDYRTPLAANIPGATVAKVPLPAGPAGNVIPGNSRLENGLMISTAAAKRPDFVAMMQFIDWLWYSDAGEEFAKWGVLGTTYTKDASGKRTLTAGVNYLNMNPSGTKDLQKDFGFSGGVFAYGGTTDLLQSTFSQEELAFQAEMLKKKVLPVPPPYPFTTDEQDQATLLDTPLKDYVTQNTLEFILGHRKMSDWDSYVAEVKAKGADQYIALVNTAHDRYVKNHG